MTQELKIDLDELERKARAATPGNWTTIKPPDSDDGWSTGVVVAAVAPRQLVYTDHQGGVAPEANREHIAANSPPVTLALVARIRELENAFESSLDEWNRGDEYDLSTSYRSLMRALIEKGAVLP